MYFDSRIDLLSRVVWDRKDVRVSKEDLEEMDD